MPTTTTATIERSRVVRWEPLRGKKWTESNQWHTTLTKPISQTRNHSLAEKRRTRKKKEKLNITHTNSHFHLALNEPIKKPVIKRKRKEKKTTRNLGSGAFCSESKRTPPPWTQDQLLKGPKSDLLITPQTEWKFTKEKKRNKKQKWGLSLFLVSFVFCFFYLQQLKCFCLCISQQTNQLCPWML